MRKVVSNASYDDLKEDVRDDVMEPLKEKLNKIGVSLERFEFNNVSYAPEIAATMLQKQQAVALVEAKRTLADGAVGTAIDIVNNLKSEGVLKEQDIGSLLKGIVVSLMNNEPAKAVISL